MKSLSDPISISCSDLWNCSMESKVHFELRAFGNFLQVALSWFMMFPTSYALFSEEGKKKREQREYTSEFSISFPFPLLAP